MVGSRLRRNEFASFGGNVTSAVSRRSRYISDLAVDGLRLCGWLRPTRMRQLYIATPFFLLYTYIFRSIARQHRWADARHVHRLDQDTSGLVVMALTAEATREMCRQFRERGEKCNGKEDIVMTLIYLARASVMGSREAVLLTTHEKSAETFRARRSSDVDRDYTILSAAHRCRRTLQNLHRCAGRKDGEISQSRHRGGENEARC